MKDNKEPLKQRKRRRYAVLDVDRGIEPGARRSLHRRDMSRQERLRQLSDNQRRRLAAETTHEREECRRQLSLHQQCRTATETT